MSTANKEAVAVPNDSTLPIIGQTLPSLANQCYFVGQGKRADVVWSRGDFQALCEHMLNGNPLEHFLAAWSDSRSGQAFFAKANRGRADKRAGWAWESITGKAKIRTGIGFYPSNREGQSRWAAIDFDAHNGERERARQWSLAAFQLLLQHPQLFLVLCSSGGGGFHLFIYTRNFHRVGEWIVLLKQVCAFIGAPIADGLCEILPNERAESLRFGKAIRAPGTLNPKTGDFSLIEAENVRLLLDSVPRTWTICVGKPQSRLPHENSELSLHERTSYYSLSTEPIIKKLLVQFPIEQVGTRNGVLVRLVGQLVFKLGREMSEQIVKDHYARYGANIRTSLKDHLRDFEVAWSGLTRNIVESLSADERRVYQNLSTEPRREGFLLARSFAGAAPVKGDSTFPIVRASFADRLNLTEAGASDVIAALTNAGAIERAQEYKRHQHAATYRWVLKSTMGSSCTTEP